MCDYTKPLDNGIFLSVTQWILEKKRRKRIPRQIQRYNKLHTCYHVLHTQISPSMCTNHNKLENNLEFINKQTKIE